VQPLSSAAWRCAGRGYALIRQLLHDFFVTEVYWVLVCAECANAYGDDMFCAFLANSGECAEDPAFMVRYCHKACSRCDVDSIGTYA